MSSPIDITALTDLAKSKFIQLYHFDDKEFIHSSEICEFFFYLAVNIMLVIAILKIFVLKADYVQQSQFYIQKSSIPSDTNLKKQKYQQPPQQQQAGAEQSQQPQSENKSSGSGSQQIQNSENAGGSSDQRVEINLQGLQDEPVQQANIQIEMKDQNQQVQQPQQQADQKKPNERPKSSTKKEFLQKQLDLIEEHLWQLFPFLGIVILNINSYGSYILCTFMTFFWVLCIILFNNLKLLRKFGHEQGQIWSEKIHQLAILVLICNFLVVIMLYYFSIVIYIDLIRQ